MIVIFDSQTLEIANLWLGLSAEAGIHRLGSEIRENCQNSCFLTKMVSLASTGWWATFGDRTKLVAKEVSYNKRCLWVLRHQVWRGKIGNTSSIFEIVDFSQPHEEISRSHKRQSCSPPKVVLGKWWSGGRQRRRWREKRGTSSKEKFNSINSSSPI